MNLILKNKKAYVSALGSMGRRHLKALIKIGCIVEAYDPNIDVFKLVKSELKKEGLNYKNFFKVTKPHGKYDFAIFSETALSRFNNFKYFLENAQADKILLEKPLSSNPGEFYSFLKLAREKLVEQSIQVNFMRRFWPHIKKIHEYCEKEEEFTMTVNGGAIGLGCNGIHFIDNFILFSGNEMPTLKWVKLSHDIVESGRGKQFYDFGGSFVVESTRGTLLASMTANSSANVVMTVKGKHFMIQVDYNTFSWKVLKRNSNIDMPLYRYGMEYELIEDGIFQIPSVNYMIEGWTQGNINLPNLETSLLSHELLDSILISGGVNPPYSFT